MLIRHADPAQDAAACLEIYARYVDGSAASFEETVPSLNEFSQRIARISRTHAFLVAQDGERIAGYAYAGSHRERAAYRWTAETTVYLNPEYHRRGLGRALYAALLPLLERQGYRLLLAGITQPNPASVALHAAVGFEDVGVYRRAGWKAGAWRDVLWMARQLGPETSETQMPPAPGPPQRLPAPIEL